MNVGNGTVRELRDWLEYLNFSGETTLTRERAANGHPDPYEIVHVGIGNESWGCGGQITPEFYANEYKRYATYASSFNAIPLYKIASGPNNADFEWTRRFFGVLSGITCKCDSHIDLVNGFAMHYYCGTAGNAIEYTSDQWYELLDKALYIETLIVQHRKIMDSFDPLRKVDLIVDEWGTWHPVIPGTPAKWLLQQNTIRDALVAAVTLDIFNRHADIVKMANIAQMINVLQAMILTQGDQMITTPTFHVYEMYQLHQNAQVLPMWFSCGNIQYKNPLKSGSVPHLAGSCSKNGKKITLKSSES